ncbi:MAG: helicase C-terminal domain-containing protein [Tepidisphaeraceae bacterium]
MSSIDSILGPDGAISRRLGGDYEPRPQQLELAHAVEAALTHERHLLAEAGTGVGKSFAYLLPAIDLAVKQKKRVVISTHTISLQEQLMQKDIPLLQSVYGDEFSAVLVKGRGNYLCRRRMDQAVARQHYLFDREPQVEQLMQIADWAECTGDGSLSSLPVQPDPGVWDKVNAEQGNCLGKKCRHYGTCHWQAAKRRMQGGQILIVNHALFFSDLALRMAGVNYLPKYDAVVFDEAHTIEDVAGQHFGLKVTEAGVRYQLRNLFDLKRGRGLLSTHGSAANDAIRTIVQIDDVVDDFFDSIVAWQDNNGRGNGRVHQANVVENALSPGLQDLAKHVKALVATLKEEEAVTELLSVATRITGLADTIDAIIKQSVEDCVYWFEIAKRTPRRVSLHAAPIDVAEGLRRELFGKCKSVILTSATLATANTKPEQPGATFDETRHNSAVATEQSLAAFAFVRKRLGLDQCDALQLGSPFDYANQATLYIDHTLPDPSDALRFLPAACESILKYLEQTNGGAFVLFTSHKMLTDAANMLKHRIEAMGLTLLVQGYGMVRGAMLEQFRSAENAVLFGTGSFWQGIDVRGDKLRNVIIVKLPFAVPDEPLTEAKLEAIRRRGGNPFMELSVPEAVIKLKQGFGRLIRSRSDRGIVAILDHRVRTKRYGRSFLDALPPCKIIDVK